MWWGGCGGKLRSTFSIRNFGCDLFYEQTLDFIVCRIVCAKYGIRYVNVVCIFFLQLEHRFFSACRNNRGMAYSSEPWDSEFDFHKKYLH